MTETCGHCGERWAKREGTNYIIHRGYLLDVADVDADNLGYGEVLAAVCRKGWRPQ